MISSQYHTNPTHSLLLIECVLNLSSCATNLRRKWHLSAWPSLSIRLSSSFEPAGCMLKEQASIQEWRVSQKASIFWWIISKAKENHLTSIIKSIHVTGACQNVKYENTKIKSNQKLTIKTSKNSFVNAVIPSPVFLVLWFKVIYDNRWLTAQHPKCLGEVMSGQWWWGHMSCCQPNKWAFKLSAKVLKCELICLAIEHPKFREPANTWDNSE